MARPFITAGKTNIEGSTAIVFAPQPRMASTQLALEALSRFKAERTKPISAVAITPAPKGIRETLALYQGQASTAKSILWCDWMEKAGVDPAVIGQHLVDLVVYMECMNPRSIVEAIRYNGLTPTGILPNVIPQEELRAAQVAELLSEHNIAYPSSSAVRISQHKPDFNRLQASLGLRTPIEYLSHYDGANETRAAQELYGLVQQIWQQTNGPAVVKGISDFGSQGVVQIDPTLPYAEQISRLTTHIKDRNEAGTLTSTVQEFIRGVEVGAHLVMGDGRIVAHYTRKDFARGKGGYHSEEAGHRYDPADPIHEVCAQALTPVFHRILDELNVQDGSLNADVILPADCFDTHGNLTTTNPLNFQQSCILEIHFRPGGEAVQKMLGKVFEVDHEKLVVASGLGYSQALNELYHSTANNAALTTTLFADYDGYVLAAPHTHSLRKVPGVFYSNAQQLGIVANEALPMPNYLEPTKDWITKLGRPVLGLVGKNQQELQTRLHGAIAALGIVLLSGNSIVSYDRQKGKYIREPIDKGYAYWLESQGFTKEARGWKKE